METLSDKDYIINSDILTKGVYMRNYDETLPRALRRKNKNNVKKKKISKNKKQYEQYKLAKIIGGNPNKLSNSKPKKLEITFDNKKYEFIYEEDENIYTIFDKNDDSRCVMITIYSEIKTAEFDNINGDYHGCPNGSILLDVSINFLKKNKKEFDILKIVLQDKSIKSCKGI